MNQLIRADWRIGINAFADLLLPGADPEAIAWFARIMREATSAETAVSLNEAAVAVDLAAVLPHISVPTLVMNARGDRVAPLEAARGLAARIPGARFTALPGDIHPVEFGTAGPMIHAICDFVSSPSWQVSGEDRGNLPPTRTAALGLSAREVEVLRLIATGLRNGEIATRLSLSIHTVERHAVNIYTKIGVRSRVEATAYVLHRWPPSHGDAT